MAKGLGLAGFTLLGILGIAARGACEERTAPAQASAFLEKRMAEAVARGGEKEQRRVLLDDLAAWTDGRYSVPIDGSCFVKILISEKSEEVAQEALPLLHIFLVRGNPDNPDFKRPADSYSLLFKRASEGWLRLATKGFTDEERALRTGLFLGS